MTFTWRTLTAALVLAVGCSEFMRPRATAVPVASPPTPSATGFAVYLTLSDNSPRPGDRILVTARVDRGKDAPPVGSFLLRVTYDSTHLHVLEPQGSAEGLVVINPINGAIAAAGASATGFTKGELFHFTLDVDDPAALNSLASEVKQLVSLKFADSRSNLIVAKELVRGLGVGR
jgi:hypothetical protein